MNVLHCISRIMSWKRIILFGLGGILVLISGCGLGTPVRHLSSDVCLVLPEKTSREQVQVYLGDPDQIQRPGSGAEVWIYMKVNRDLVRNMPLVGDSLGSQDYEVVTVTFDGELVSTCVYRQLSDEEFRQLGEVTD
ncbi:MAG: hypothetical protein KJ950_06985 [Proteobacteria bacterium]|nr:hypothetical protein [Pseudomonadota bacterium]MBU1686989.1 hypothetical protein [Pseudomonadota bacterium]